MVQKEYIIEGRHFRTQMDYARASRDKTVIDELRKQTENYNAAQLKRLREELQSGKYRFLTLLGQDFEEELDERIRRAEEKEKGKKGRRPDKKSDIRQKANTRKKPDAGNKADAGDESLDAYVQAELVRQEKRRKWLIMLCGAAAVGCLGYFGVYSYYNYRTRSSYEELANLKGKPVIAEDIDSSPVIHYTDESEKPQKEILDEYKNLVNKNQRLIGWVKIDDTNIDYPVMQTTNNEYYQDHNLNQEYDKNGSIFMDKDCDVLKPSTNFILYGHHMKNGQMFGKLDLYEKKEYYEEHPYIQFDTIYEKGLYQIMYVFRSRVYSEEDVVFKYYQFIDALSEQEFDSNMQEMAAVSLYDTGVSAQYGDGLLTLSTCDYQEKNGRFVVVAKKVKQD